jgi:hypothetical protein
MISTPLGYRICSVLAVGRAYNGKLIVWDGKMAGILEISVEGGLS